MNWRPEKTLRDRDFLGCSISGCTAAPVINYTEGASDHPKNAKLDLILCDVHLLTFTAELDKIEENRSPSGG